MIRWGSVLFLFVLLVQTFFGATNNPFPNSIPDGDLIARVTPVVTIPNSEGTFPRVNQLLEAPDGQLFALVQTGEIYRIDVDAGTALLFLDLEAVSGITLRKTNEAGLQSMAFHPSFVDSGQPGYGKFYTIHSSTDRSPLPDFAPGGGSNAHDTVLLEWSTGSPGAVPFSADSPVNPYREVLRLEQPYGNHNAGLIAFNPNVGDEELDFGHLYVAIGDGGSSGDPLDLSQNQLNPYGAILRINPLQNGTDAYTVPPGNPFVQDSSGLDEIWAYGLRNPQRYSWDSRGRMFIADIGQGVVEEINLGVPGANYGWNEREGSYEYISTSLVGDSPVRSDTSTTGYAYPVVEYDHGEGNAVTAGFVYEGAVNTLLEGKFLFGDIRRGRVFYFDARELPDGGQESIRELRLLSGEVEKSYLDIIKETNSTAFRADLRFGADSKGNIYLVNKRDGVISRLDPLPNPEVTSFSIGDSGAVLQFSGESGVVDWQVFGTDELSGFTEDLSAISQIEETSPGIYRVVINISGIEEDRYFIRIER